MSFLWGGGEGEGHAMDTPRSLIHIALQSAEEHVGTLLEGGAPPQPGAATTLARFAMSALASLHPLRRRHTKHSCLCFIGNGKRAMDGGNGQKTRKPLMPMLVINLHYHVQICVPQRRCCILWIS